MIIVLFVLFACVAGPVWVPEAGGCLRAVYPPRGWSAGSSLHEHASTCRSGVGRISQWKGASYKYDFLELARPRINPTLQESRAVLLRSLYRLNSVLCAALRSEINLLLWFLVIYSMPCPCAVEPLSCRYSEVYLCHRCLL